MSVHAAAGCEKHPKKNFYRHSVPQMKELFDCVPYYFSCIVSSVTFFHNLDFFFFCQKGATGNLSGQPRKWPTIHFWWSFSKKPSRTKLQSHKCLNLLLHRHSSQAFLSLREVRWLRLSFHRRWTCTPTRLPAECSLLDVREGGPDRVGDTRLIENRRGGSDVWLRQTVKKKEETLHQTFSDVLTW